jgi:adenylate cyclase, class 2
MQSAEIELKFPLSDPAAFQSRLSGLGFHLDTPRTFEQNTLFDTPSRDLLARREILRIRQYGALCYVTHKRRPDPTDPANDTRYKVRIETETVIAEGPVMAAIFEQLGYIPSFVYEKYRTVWSRPIESSDQPQTEPTPQAHLVIDETPIGTWAELEGPIDWIDRTLSELGIDPTTCLTDSYGKLFLDWKQRTGSLAENLTFSEICTPTSDLALASH